MEVVIVPDEGAAARLVAGAIEDLLGQAAHPVLGLATGSSPLPTYRELARRRGDPTHISVAHARAFLLDEYVGLPFDHPLTYRNVIRRDFALPVGFPDDRLDGPDGSVDALPGSPADYEQRIADAGGIDLQLLGIGTDGHIGFNEPGSSLASRTRLKTLTDVTRRDNARFFGGEIDAVPRHVITQGIGTILDSRHVVMIATGAAKADPVARAVEGPVMAMVPASALQLHPHATVVVDEAAAADLRLADYYREAWAHKPDWQGL